jgi:Cu/Ag efflux protein CusF
MTGTRWIVAGLAMAGLLTSAPARAGDDSVSAKSAGTVQQLDETSREITLSGSRARLMVTNGTEIRKDGRRASFSDLREGDEVRASFSGSGESRTVEKLDVMSGPDPFYHPSHDSP